MKLFWLHDREVPFEAGLHHVVLKRTVPLDGRVRLGNHGAVLVLGREVHHVLVVGGSLSLGHLAVRRFDESETVHLGIHTEA